MPVCGLGRHSAISAGFRLAQVTLRKHRNAGWQCCPGWAGILAFPPGSGWRKSPFGNTGMPAGSAVRVGPAFWHFRRVPAGVSHPLEIPECRLAVLSRLGRHSGISAGFRLAQVTLRKHRNAVWQCCPDWAGIPAFPPDSGWRKFPPEIPECRCLNWLFFPQIIFLKYFSKLSQGLVLLVIRYREKRLRGVRSTLSHPL